MALVSRLKPPDARLERKICTSMIISDEYLRQVREIYREDSLKLGFTKKIADWCIEYYEQYKRAPNIHIEDIFHAKTKHNFPPEMADEIADFLADISEEYQYSEKINVEYLLKQTEDHFRLCSLDALRVQLNKAVISGNAEEGEALTKGYQRVVRQQTKGVDIFRSIEPIISTFSEKANNNTVLTFPGEFGRMCGPLEREHLVCFVGNTGVGKTWFLLLCSWWAALDGHDVLYVSFEMSQKQVAYRSYQFTTGLPKRAGVVYIPQWDCQENQIGSCPYPNKRTGTKSLLTSTGSLYPPDQYPVDYKPCAVCMNATDKTKFNFLPATYMKKSKREALSMPSAMHMRNLFEKSNKRAGRFIFVRWPARSKSMDDLRLYMQNLEEYEGITPSLLVTDYANKMKAAGYNRERRWNIEDVFIDHKAIGQERNILVITGHQGNTVRDGKDLGRGNWQEGISGLNECDLSIMLNQKETDKDAGVYRALIGKKRDDEYSATGQLWITSCLSIGRPYLDSYWQHGNIKPVKQNEAKS